MFNVIVYDTSLVFLSVIRPELIPVSLNMKRLGVFQPLPLPMDELLVHRRVTYQYYIHRFNLFTPD